MVDLAAHPGCGEYATASDHGHRHQRTDLELTVGPSTA